MDYRHTSVLIKKNASARKSLGSVVCTAFSFSVHYLQYLGIFSSSLVTQRHGINVTIHLMFYRLYMAGALPTYWKKASGIVYISQKKIFWFSSHKFGQRTDLSSIIAPGSLCGHFKNTYSRGLQIRQARTQEI